MNASPDRGSRGVLRVGLRAVHPPASQSVSRAIPTAPVRHTHVLQQPTRRCIQRRVWVGRNEETLDDEENVFDAVFRRPVLLERRNANLPTRVDVGVKDLCLHGALGRARGKVDAEKVELDQKIAAMVGRAR